MACQDCEPNGPVTHFPAPAFNPCPNGCQESGCGPVPVRASCVENDGVDLPCIGATSRERLDTILQKIDQRLCQGSSGDNYDSYDLRCLEPVPSQQDFAEKVALMLCTLNGDYANFTTTVFPAQVETIINQIADLDKAGFSQSCPVLEIAETDSLSISLFKLSAALCQLYGLVTDLGGVHWQACTITDPVPTTLQEGFNYLIAQICALSDGGVGATLPTFDNTGTCLPSATATDTLADTIIKIRTRLCSTPTFSISALTPGCLSFSGISTLDELLNRMLAALETLSRNTVRQVDTSQFSIADADPAAPCAGKKLLLSGGTGTDRLVAVNDDDMAPGTLENKIAVTGGLFLSATATPGKLTIGGAAVEDEKVKISAADSTAGYLEDKLVGKSADVTIAVTPVNDQLEVAATVDYQLLIERLFDAIETDPDIRARFCAIMATCPSPCQPPTNVEAIAV